MKGKVVGGKQTFLCDERLGGSGGGRMMDMMLGPRVVLVGGSWCSAGLGSVPPWMYCVSRNDWLIVVGVADGFFGDARGCGSFGAGMKTNAFWLCFLSLVMPAALAGGTGAVGKRSKEVKIGYVCCHPGAGHPQNWRVWCDGGWRHPQRWRRKGCRWTGGFTWIAGRVVQTCGDGGCQLVADVTGGLGWCWGNDASQ